MLVWVKKNQELFLQRVKTVFYPDQDQCSVGPDMGPNCLQRLSADSKSHSFNLNKERVIRGNKI